MTSKIEKLKTEKGKSYWNKTGAYQKEWGAKYEALVPDSGEATTIHGELIRVASRLFYDFCNNGNCNVLDHKYEMVAYDCHNCHRTGMVDDYDLESGDELEEQIVCEECGGSGEIEEEEQGDVFITEFYEELIDFLEMNLTNNGCIDRLKSFLLDNSNGYNKYKFTDEEMAIYNDICDEVMYQVLTTENIKRNIKN